MRNSPPGASSFRQLPISVTRSGTCSSTLVGIDQLDAAFFEQQLALRRRARTQRQSDRLGEVEQQIGLGALDDVEVEPAGLIVLPEPRLISVGRHAPVSICLARSPAKPRAKPSTSA